MPTQIPNIFLNASAGSGKTFALCARYIALLFQGVKANEILTLTFTKKAANEMKERITQNLFILYITQAHKEETIKARYNLNFDEYGKLLKMRINIIHALQDYNIDAHTIDSKIKQVYKQFLRADTKIGTIDSFFAQVLRKFAFFIGMRRDFQSQEKAYNDEVFSLFLQKVYQNEACQNTLRTLMQDMNVFLESSYNNTLTLKVLLAILYDKSIEFHNESCFFQSMQPHHTLERVRKEAQFFLKTTCKEHSIAQKSGIGDIYNEIIKHIDSVISGNKAMQSSFIATRIFLHAEQLAAFLESLMPPNTTKKRVIALCEKLKSKDLETIITHKLIIEKKHLHITQDVKPNEYMQAFIHDMCEDICNLAILHFLYQESILLAHVYMLLEKYKEAMQEVENKENALSFQAITHKVFHIATDTLQQQEAFESDYFYFRLDSVMSHVLFDEYQDTNSLQYRIFLPIFEEIIAGHGTKDSKSLFFVGDSKQSLYAFRGANPYVFEAARKLYSMQQQSLAHNYRSKSAIIDFVNARFAPIYGEEYIQQLYSQNAQEAEGFVSIQLYQDENGETKGKGKKDSVLASRIYTDALAHIQELLALGIAKKDIAILARKRATLHEFAYFLQEQKSDIVLNLDKNGKLATQKSIQAIFYALKIQDYKNEIHALKEQIEHIEEARQEEGQIDSNTLKSLALESSLSQPLLPESLKERLKTLRNLLKFAQKKMNKLLGKSYFEDFYLQIPKKSLAQQIKFVMESCRLYNQDCMELLEIASEHIDIKNIDALFTLIENTESIIMQEEAIPAMSVHASKGLGFDYVVYVDCEAHNDSKEEKIYYDYNEIFLQNIRIDTTKTATKLYRDSALKNLIEKKEQENMAQEHNNLYVACTRAKNGLALFAHEKSTIAQTLALEKNEYYGIPPQSLPIQKQTTHQKKPTIISQLALKRTLQEHFLHEQTMPLYHNNLALHDKKIKGLSLHYCLELMLGYEAKNIPLLLSSNYGFYIEDSMQKEILKKAQNLYDSSLKKLWFCRENVIQCEIPFLQEKSIKRLDAIAWHDNAVSIIEFKSSERVSEALLREHTAQLKSYMQAITALLEYKMRVKGYLVYLQDTIAVKEITL